MNMKLFYILCYRLQVLSAKTLIFFDHENIAFFVEKIFPQMQENLRVCKWPLQSLNINHF